jgi:hypothetical protein
MSEIEQEEPEFEVEEWVYLGPHSTMAASYRWRDPNGQVLTYGKLRGRVFGAIYQIRVQRGPEDNVRVLRETTWAGRMAEDAATIEARALEVEARLKVKRLEANTSRTATIDEAIAPLLELAGSIKSMSDRRALLDYITARVYQAKPPS